jgi:hypothetical protein
MTPGLGQRIVPRFRCGKHTRLMFEVV